VAAAQERGMIAGMRGLVALAAIALGLALVLALVPPASGVAIESRAVLPGFAGDASELDWKRPRGPDVHLDKHGEEWQLVRPPGIADQRAVAAVLASVRGARWHRRGERARAGTIHATLTITGVGASRSGMATPDHVIELGDPIHGADQAWIVVDDTALLVDGWLARALDPDPLALRERMPLGDAHAANRIALDGGGHHVAIAGTPRRDNNVVVAPELVERFEHACEQLELVRMPDGPLLAAPADSVRIVADSAFVTVGGACPGDPRLVAVRARTGDGCVDPAAWRAVLDAATALDRPPEAVADPHPVAAAINAITLPDGALTLDRRPSILIGSTLHAADPDRVAELVRALAEPATVELPRDPFPDAAAVHIRIDAATSVDLALAGGVIRRGTEPIVLRPSREVLAILERPARLLLDTTRWIEEPSTITRIVVDGATYRPGAVVGEWTRAPAGSFDPALVSALASTLAQVRAPGRDGTVTPLHTVEVTFAPPVGQGAVHVLQLGAPTVDGCPAVVDGITVTAPAALCTAAAAVAAR
jgi:hypothetical protein